MSDMKKVFKYPVDIEDEVSVLMPKDAKILTVQVQNDKPCIWAAVDPTETYSEFRKFRIAGTGHSIEDGADDNYIGTIQMYGGKLVLHVFEIK
jgi:hypothetical protein